MSRWTNYKFPLTTPHAVLKLSLVAALIATVSVFHFSINIGTYLLHGYHVVFRMLYLIPIVAAGVWFFLPGSILATLIVSIIFGIHIFTAWTGDEMENTNQIAMIVVYWLVAIVVGVLSSLDARDRRIAEDAERRKQSEVILNAFEALSQALRWRDSNTQRHSEEVAAFSVAIAEKMGLQADRVEQLRLAARIHDIGKIGIHDDILLKPDRLSVEERETMERHPMVAADMVKAIPGTHNVSEIVMAHHECPDGSGYPRGLKRSEIPLESLILGVADTFSALTEERPYKDAMDVEHAFSILYEMAGTRLDSGIVGILKTIVVEQKKNASSKANEDGIARPKPDVLIKV